MRPTVLVEMAGGTVQNVLSNSENNLVLLLDWDEVLEGEAVVSNDELVKLLDQIEGAFPYHTEEDTCESLREVLLERGYTP